LPAKIFEKFSIDLSKSLTLLRLLISGCRTMVVVTREEVAMRCIVLIYDDFDEGRFFDRFEGACEPQSPASASAVSSASAAERRTCRSRASRLEITRLCSIARRPLVRWFAAPILGVPSVYGGYSTMLNFVHGMGVAPSLWLHLLAVVAGVASGLAVIARLRT
jgi:hypothetical protein